MVLRRQRRAAGWAVLCGLLAGAGGCDWFEDPTPEQVRVLVTGEGGKPAALVMSQAFNAGVSEAGNTQVELFAADTIVRMLPFDTIIRLEGGAQVGGAKRFFFEARRDEEDLSSVGVKIYLDSALRFDVGGPLATQVYRWAYVFNQLFTGTVEVI